MSTERSNLRSAGRHAPAALVSRYAATDRVNTETRSARERKKTTATAAIWPTFAQFTIDPFDRRVRNLGAVTFHFPAPSHYQGRSQKCFGGDKTGGLGTEVPQRGPGAEPVLTSVLISIVVYVQPFRRLLVFPLTVFGAHSKLLFYNSAFRPS